MKEIYNKDPVNEDIEIKDGLLNIVILSLPKFEERENKIIYGWRLEEDYWVWVKSLLDVINKKLRKQGLLVMISKISLRLLNEVDNKGFNLRKQYIWDNGKMKNIFVFTRDTKMEVKTLLRYYQEKSKVSSKKINNLLGVSSGGGGYWSLYTGNNKRLQIPSLNHWERLQNLFKMDINYEDILSEYEENKDDIWRCNQDGLYERILGLNGKKEVYLWEIFGGKLNGLDVYERENINYIVNEYDKKKYFKLLSKKN